MRHVSEPELKRAGRMDALLMILVGVLVCLLFVLSFTSVNKQIDSQKFRLQNDAEQLDNGVNESYAPFFMLYPMLSESLQNAGTADATLGSRIAFDADAEMSYLVWETDGAACTLVSALDMRSSFGTARAEAANALAAFAQAGRESQRHCYYISNAGYAVFCGTVLQTAFLDETGSFAAAAALLSGLAELTAGMEPEPIGEPSLAGPMMRSSTVSEPYESFFGDGTVISYLTPVSIDGETVGALGCDVTLADLDILLGRIPSGIGTLYLLSGDGAVLAARAYGESLLEDGGIAADALHQLDTLNITQQNLSALDKDPDAILWRGTRIIITAPAQASGVRVVYVISLFSLLSEGNLLLWFALCTAAMVVIIALFATLIKSRRKIMESNLRLMEDVSKLDDQSHYDKLTGLMTAESIIETIDHFIQMTPVTVMMLDIDKFKQINDRFLHTFGNVVLKRIASIIKENMPRNAYAGRFGGDEFLCMLIGANPKLTCEIAEAIRVAVETLRFREHETTVTLSIGIAESWNNVSKDVLNKADAMLYKAKENGRNQWVYEEKEE